MTTLYVIMAILFMVTLLTQYMKIRSMQATFHAGLRLASYFVIVLLVNYLYNAYVERLGYCPLGTLNPIVIITLAGTLLAGVVMSVLFSYFPKLFKTEKGMYLLGWNEEMITREKYRSIDVLDKSHYLLTSSAVHLKTKKLWLPRKGEAIYQQLKSYLEEA